MVTVCQFFSSLSSCGAETRTLELIQHLPSGTVNVVAFQMSGSRGVLSDAFEKAGTRVVTHRFRTLGFWARVIREFAASRTTVAHIHVKRGNSRSALFLPLAWALHVPVRIAHFRSDGAGPSSDFTKWIGDWLARKTIDMFATNIVGVSPGALTYGWRSDWPNDPRCSVLLSGLDLTRFEDLSYAPQLHAELGLSPNNTIILHVGRDVPVKNRDRAIDILATIRETQPDTHLVFAGRSDVAKMDGYMQRLQALHLSSHVHFLGERSDIHHLMACANLLLLTSHHEGLPGVVLEAHAAGTPVLASDLPGTRYLSDRLPDMHLVNLSTANLTWAKTAIAVLENPPSPHQRRARLQALHGSPFDLNTATGNYLKLWRIEPM